MKVQVLIIATVQTVLFLTGLILSLLWMETSYYSVVPIVIFSLMTLRAIWKMIRFNTIYRAVNGYDESYKPLTNKEKAAFTGILILPILTVIIILFTKATMLWFAIPVACLLALNYYFGLIANYRFHLYQAYYQNRLEGL